MGLFDGLRRQRDVTLTPRSAMLLACISMVAADGDIDDDEIAIIRRIDGNADSPDWGTAIDTWKRVPGPNECVDLTAPQLDDEQRRFTMANLIDIAMADGVLAGAEKELLERYVDAFQLDDEFVRHVVDVISIKNDQAPF